MRLGEVAKVISGYAFKSKDFTDSGIPVIKIKNIKNGYVDLSDVQYIEKEFLSLDKKFHISTGDILISLTGSHLTQPGSVVGRVAIQSSLNDLCLLNQRAGKIIVTNPEKCNSKYLFYFLNTEESRYSISSRAHGAANQANVSPGQIESLEIDLPPLPLQQKIAGILTAYDDLIENNTRRIQIMEEMAQRIYREWFVYFSYPNHENDKLVESELGMIPVGWEVKKPREFVLNVRQSERAGDHLLSVPYVPIDCIPRKSLFLNSAKPGSEAKSSLISFQKYDVLFGAMRSYFHKVVISPFNGTTRATCFVLRPIDPGYYAFTVLTLFQESTIDFANSHSRGSTMPYAVWDDGLAEMPAIYPSKEVALDFNKIVEPMLKRIALGFFEQKNLRQTRDFLLPKLISGKIDVSELDVDIGVMDESLQ